MSDEPSATGSRGPLAQVAAYLAVCLGFVAACALSGALLHLGDRASGVDAPGPVARAWFQAPSVADKGFVPGSTVKVVVVTPSSPARDFRASCGGTRLVATTPGASATTRVVYSVRVLPTCIGTWLTIAIGGLHHSLQAWVR